MNINFLIDSLSENDEEAYEKLKKLSEQFISCTDDELPFHHVKYWGAFVSYGV